MPYNPEFNIKHKLKISEQYFADIIYHNKKIEIRYNDRDFQVGDLVILEEVDENCIKTGDSVLVLISYVCDFPVGLKDGYVAFGFYLVSKDGCEM